MDIFVCVCIYLFIYLLWMVTPWSFSPTVCITYLIIYTAYVSKQNCYSKPLTNSFHKQTEFTVISN